MSDAAARADDATFVPDELPSDAAITRLVESLTAAGDPARRIAAEPVDGLIDTLTAGASAAALLDRWSGDEAWPHGWWRTLLTDDLELEQIEAAKHQAKRAFALAAADTDSTPRVGGNDGVGQGGQGKLGEAGGREGGRRGERGGGGTVFGVFAGFGGGSGAAGGVADRAARRDGGGLVDGGGGRGG